MVIANKSHQDILHFAKNISLKRAMNSAEKVPFVRECVLQSVIKLMKYFKAQ